VRRELRQIALLRDRGLYEEALESARRLADGNLDSQEAQFAAGELAYLLSRWTEAVRFFERGGEPGEGGQVIRFYFAVALFETGQTEAARAMLAPVVGTLARNEFVDRTVQRIMGRL
jgi:tetratricopeptide (TPR) repeat protein